MLTDWSHWISSLHPEEIGLLAFALLAIDTPRYVLTRLLLVAAHLLRDGARWLTGRAQPPAFDHCPSVAVIVAAWQEERCLEATLASVWGTYPRLQILVVDDGSTDATGDVARAFARSHDGCLVLARPERGGKSSCVNFALPYARAEIVVVMDADTRLDPHALWEVVQPFRDPRVGGVSATLLVREPFRNLLGAFQAYEYLASIFVGRMVSAALGILGIVSGGFGAFRREAIDRVGAWDVGPGEDGDLTLRIRKAGYRIAFAPYAQSYTQAPRTWGAWFRQRRRWNRGVVRYKCRKHVDMAWFWTPGFRWGNFFVLLNVWFFNIVCLYGFWAAFAWMLGHASAETPRLLLFAYLAYVAMHVLQVPVILYYSLNRARDAAICAVIPLLPFYQLAHKAVRLFAATEEIFLRRSYDDRYVPAHVGAATWRW